MKQPFIVSGLFDKQYKQDQKVAKKYFHSYDLVKSTNSI